MKYAILFAVALAGCAGGTGNSISDDAAAADTTLAIVPEPVSIMRAEGRYDLPSTVNISVSGATGDGSGQISAQLDSIAAAVAGKLKRATGYEVNQSEQGSGVITLALNATADKQLGDEGYVLQVNQNGISINANAPAGIFYGVQTLWQLFPPAIEAPSAAKGASWSLPMVTITDYPRFAWRGLMFDVSRHFFTKEQVKQYIDDMVRYKYNLLHLHLTDDQGWRIEIKSLPKLTEVGAWNVKKTGTFGSFSTPAPDAPRNFGGFFTQNDIKELVQYAKSRYVDILPEVDIPGHSLAAIASYPELSCTPGTYKVNSGEKFMDWHAGGFSALVDNTLCPANEQVYTFLDKVFTEVAQLFPFPYIHMGGDECAKNFWEKSAAVKALMQREHLKDMHEVQSYFVKRVEKIIESKGKKMIGWDEILEGGLAPNAAVMSWRGVQGGIEAARMGHEVVMSPTTFAYLDYMQGDPAIEPPVYASLRLKKAYSFDPVPEGVDPKYIKGGQANLWTEQVYNMRHAEYMVWPRGLAIAEDVWSPKEKKNWNDFVSRVQQQFKRLDMAGIKYATSIYEPDVKASIDDSGRLLMELEPEIDGLELYYSFDNSYPDNHYPKYEAAVAVPEDARLLRVVSYKDGRKVGRFLSLPVDDLRKRVPKK